MRLPRRPSPLCLAGLLYAQRALPPSFGMPAHQIRKLPCMQAQQDIYQRYAAMSLSLSSVLRSVLQGHTLARKCSAFRGVRYRMEGRKQVAMRWFRYTGRALPRLALLSALTLAILLLAACGVSSATNGTTPTVTPTATRATATPLPRYLPPQ